MIIEFLLCIPILLFVFLGTTEAVRAGSMKQTMRVTAFQAARELSFQLASDRNFPLSYGASGSSREEVLSNERWLASRQKIVSQSIFESLSVMPLWMPADVSSGNINRNDMRIKGRAHLSFENQRTIKVKLEVCLPVAIFSYADYLKEAESSPDQSPLEKKDAVARGCFGQYPGATGLSTSIRFWKLSVEERFSFTPSYFVFRQGLAFPANAVPFSIPNDLLTSGAMSKAEKMRANWLPEVHRLVNSLNDGFASRHENKNSVTLPSKKMVNMK